ncbi:hypothetical protein BDV96DRAFT_571265 [Lophiotrema nucula]|uniref:Uncharacterized protein n=1 Tax=Lophiotrema nucula TaxID=690887 RepID=A0A6A5ZEV7_9PLEO|nr:hypothetical protein BDV96DRAFT_571265 [Lophiotrema nucula]
MTASQDTVSWTTETQAYRTYWFDAFKDKVGFQAKESFLAEASEACVTYGQIANNLGDIFNPTGGVIDPTTFSQRERDFLRLLKWYYFGTAAALRQARTFLAEEQGKADTEASEVVRDALLVECNSLNQVIVSTWNNLNGFRTCLLRCTTMDSLADPNDGPDKGKVKIANRQVLEELVMIAYERKPDQDKPRTLVTVKTMCQSLLLYQQPLNNRLVGLPQVLFACIGELNPPPSSVRHPLIATCSNDQWTHLHTLRGRLNEWRATRYGAKKQTLSDKGTKAFNRFNQTVGPYYLTRTTQPVGTRDPQLSNIDYGNIVGFMSNPLPDPNPPTSDPWSAPYITEDILTKRLEIGFGIDRTGHAGRSFHGCGNDLFQEMSRCWKCRFLHLYVHISFYERVVGLSIFVILLFAHFTGMPTEGALSPDPEIHGTCGNCNPACFNEFASW